MDKEKKPDKYEVTLPNPDRPGCFTHSDPLTKEESLAFVQEYYGADENGNVCLITPLPGDEEEGDDNDV